MDADRAGYGKGTTDDNGCIQIPFSQAWIKDEPGLNVNGPVDLEAQKRDPRPPGERGRHEWPWPLT